MKRFKTWRTAQGAALYATLVLLFVLVKIIELIILPFLEMGEVIFGKKKSK